MKTLIQAMDQSMRIMQRNTKRWRVKLEEKDRMKNHSKFCIFRIKFEKSQN